MNKYLITFIIVAVIVIILILTLNKNTIFKNTNNTLPLTTVGAWELKQNLKEGMIDTDNNQFRAIGLGYGPRDGMSGTVKIILTGGIIGNTGDTIADIAVCWSSKSNRPSRGTGLEIPRYPGLELIKVQTLPLPSDREVRFSYEAKIRDLPGASYWFDVAIKTKESRIVILQNIILRIQGE